MRFGARTAASYRIAQNMAKYQGKPRDEILFNEYQELRGMSLIWGKRLPFFDLETSTTWNFECDFLNPVDGGFDIDYEIDGEKFHETKTVNGIEVSAGTDAWKDRVKNANGIKVIHIKAILTERRWWPHLDSEIPKAQLSKRGSIVIPA